MYRTAMETLYRWKESRCRRPLVIRGARRVGKTWLMREFGRSAYAEAVCVNFKTDVEMAQIFASEQDPSRLVAETERHARKKIDPGHTLLLFDEVQEAPGAVAAISRMYENVPRYHVVCSGFFGSTLYGGASFPDGTVDFLNLLPLTLREFLMAAVGERFAQALDRQDHPMMASFQQTYVDALKQYFFVGGMPEAVQGFVEGKSLYEVREVQKRILSVCEQDFSERAPVEILPKVRAVWNSIPVQLANEDKMFHCSFVREGTISRYVLRMLFDTYNLVREGMRTEGCETAVTWLCDCGLAHRVNRVSAAAIPLKAHADRKSYKLFLIDVGLLGCMSGLHPDVLTHGNDVLAAFHGALTEQYICQQLKAADGLDVCYHVDGRGSCAVDFVVDTGERVIPIEVGVEVSRKAKGLKLRNLKAYQKTFHPEYAILASTADYEREGWLTSLPLYAVGGTCSRGER